MHKPVVVLMSFVLTLAAVLFLDGDRRARADIPPPDSCTAPGQPCNTAGPAFNQAGTCTPSTCTRTVPAPDGGTMSMTYGCNLCKVSGTGGTGGTGSGGGASGTGGGSSGGGGAGGGGTADAGTTPPSKGSGCAVGGDAEAGWLGRALLLAGLLGLFHARRRRCP